MNLLLLKNVTFSLTKRFLHRYKRSMAGVAQLVRAPGCGPGGRRFKTGHSPHILLTVFLGAGVMSAEQPQNESVSPAAVVDNVITNQICFHAKHEKPHITIIVDQFCMREDISRNLLSKLSSDVILCVPSHCILQEKIIEDAQKFNFNLSISIDYLNEEQWPKLQEAIAKYPWIKGLVVWSVASDLNLIEFLKKVKEWLNTRGIWMVYANTNNILPNPAMPLGVFMPDGFVKSIDKDTRVTEQADFVLSQAKFKNRGLLLIQPGIQHVPHLIDWLQANIGHIQLDNWSK